MADVIECHDLVKKFGSFRALDGLDLTVSAGEVHGFLGPNGSGKSTTIRVLLGLLHASAGTVRLLGGDPWGEATQLHRRLAYVPGEVTLWPQLTGGEVIDVLSRMRGEVDPARRDALLERFELDPTKKSRTYSKGNRQKVGLVAALASRAELLILDEPTSGLDPLMEEQFQACIREVRREGRTVLLSSHILAEVEELCDRVSIIRAGRTVRTGTLDDLRELTLTRIVVETAEPVPELTSRPGVVSVQRLDSVDGADVHKVAFQVGSEHLESTVSLLAGHGVRSLISHPPTLEELFVSQFGDRAPPPVQDPT